MNRQSSYYAALDLGSNSFHLIIVQRTETGLQEVDKIKHMVRLGEGLGKDNNLDEASIIRALDALSEMGQRISHIPREQIRAVGTNTMRVAKNGEDFLRRAQEALGTDIEIISGNEEARLIYLGITEHNSFEDENLVIDVGGGSTEVIVGNAKKPQELRSMKMGCANMAAQFFPNGEITRKGINKALAHVGKNIEPHVEVISQVPWQRVIMSSGTAKQAEKVLVKMGLSQTGITRRNLDKMLEKLIDIGHADELSEKLDVDEARATGFTGGVCILAGLCENLKIDNAIVSQRALREGVLLDLMGYDGDRAHDEREITVLAMQKRFNVDIIQAARVCHLANYINQSMPTEVPYRFRPLLKFAADLHEIGLAVSLSRQQNHGAYLVEHADMPGFSRMMQKMMAILLKGQRKKMPIKMIDGLNAHYHNFIWEYVLSLRLAVLLYRSRSPIDGSDYPRVGCENGVLTLNFTERYLKFHPLTVADLLDEQAYWEDAPFNLKINITGSR